MIKKIIIVVFVFLHARHLFSCLGAYQHRLIPLGTIENKIVVVELKLGRSEIDGKWEAEWRGPCYLRVYKHDYKLVESELLENLYFPDSISSFVFKRVLDKAIATAIFKYNLQLAVPEYFSFCDYRDNCKKVQTVIDTVLHKGYILYRETNQKHELNVLLDSNSFAAEYIASTMPGKTLDSIAEPLYINSVRVIKCGNEQFLFIHLGTGHHSNLVKGGTYPPGKEYYPKKFNFKKVQDQAFVEPVLHHGSGFDVFFKIE